MPPAPRFAVRHRPRPHPACVQVCWPHEAARVYFLQIFTRPDGGQQRAGLCADDDYSCVVYTFTVGGAVLS